MHNVPAMALGGGFQLSSLVRRRLAARRYSQVKGSALCARYCLRLASRLGHRPPASAGTLASTAVNGEREKPLKTGHFGCRISPGFSEHSAATHLSAIAAARLHVCESQRANVVRVDPRPYRHARLSPMKLAGDPNSPVRFKDDATADELRAELMKRLRILVSAGLIDLSFAPAGRWNSASAGSWRRSIGHQRGVTLYTLFLANCECHAANAFVSNSAGVDQCQSLKRKAVGSPIHCAGAFWGERLAPEQKPHLNARIEPRVAVVRRVWPPPFEQRSRSVKPLYSSLAMDGFIEAAPTYGVQVENKYSYALSDRQFGSIVASVKRDDPAAVYATGYFFTGGPLVAQLRAGGVTAPIIGSQAFNSQKFIDIAGPAAEGTYIVDSFNRGRTDMALQRFFAEFQKRAGYPPENVAAITYSPSS